MPLTRPLIVTGLTIAILSPATTAQWSTDPSVNLAIADSAGISASF